AGRSCLTTGSLRAPRRSPARSSGQNTLLSHLVVTVSLSQCRWHRVACPGQSQAISHTLCTRNTTMTKLASSIRSFVRDEEGATAVEYGLIVALIAAVIVTVVGLVGTDVTNA